MPETRAGLIKEKSFAGISSQYRLGWNAQNIALKTPIAFSVALPQHSFYCTKIVGPKTYFAMNFQPSDVYEYATNPKQLAVFWDVSGSSSKRNASKEINFLKQFMAYHRVKQLTVFPFNNKILDTAVFVADDNFNTRWQDYLQDQEYTGATPTPII